MNEAVKKPKLIYLIALWIFLQKSYYTTVPLQVILGWLGKSLDMPRPISSVILIASFVVLGGLIQLRPWARIVAFGLVGIATFFCVALFRVTLFGSTLGLVVQAHPPKAYILPPLFIVGNLAILWYLARPRFGERCRRYRAQVDRVEEDRELVKANAKMLRDLPQK